MNARLAAAAVALALLVGSTAVGAKGRTTRITLTGPSGPTVQITDKSVGQFNVWSGAGVTIGGVPQSHGFIVEWGPSVPAPPADLPRYEVTFHTAREDKPEHLAYVVTYVLDRAAGHGYVYLPRRDEPHGDLNTQSIRRGVEGQWFRATAAWDAFIRPPLARAAATREQIDAVPATLSPVKG